MPPVVYGIWSSQDALLKVPSKKKETKKKFCWLTSSRTDTNDFFLRPRRSCWLTWILSFVQRYAGDFCVSCVWFIVVVNLTHQPLTMQNNNSNNNNNNNNVISSSSSSSAAPRGRKYGLSGGGQAQHPQPTTLASTATNVQHTSMMTVAQLVEAGRKLSVRETDQRNSWMYALSDRWENSFFYRLLKLLQFVLLVCIIH